jgi:formylglycine-generating enzyme required for sulfatase activity
MTAPGQAVGATRDAYVGLENPTQDEWQAWHGAMLAERAAALGRAGVDLAAYDDPATAWSDSSFRQFFLFLYDSSFYDAAADRYRTPELVQEWAAKFGRVDSVLLWHAYPRLGFDSRTQFDFYRDMPGGLARLRRDVTDVLHRGDGAGRAIRVFVDYNPWDAGTYDDLAEVVAALDADGVMLDTMTEVPDALERAVRRRKPGVVFAPELRPADGDLGRVRQSWAQWFDVGDARTPSVYRHRWLVPRHRQLAIRRWDTSRRGDVVYSFFNGSGLILWDNVFGTWNPYPREDRRLIAETAALLDRYEDLFVRGAWLPLVPTGVAGLDGNRWSVGRRSILTLRNRTTERVHARVPADVPAGLACASFWSDPREVAPGDLVAVEPEGVQALVVDDPASLRRAMDHFRLLSRRADVALPGYDERCPRPRRAESRGAPPARAPSASSPSMIRLPAGTFDMVVRHERRECGCYPSGATDGAMWGWFYKDVVTHQMRVTVPRFAIRATAVTNAEFLGFVHATGYRPQDDARFLHHLARTADGSLPGGLTDDQGSLPVTFVSLADARAYAAWCGQRLPTEAEWQWAAEGAGAGNRYPWRGDERSVPGEIRPARDVESATPQGVMGLSGNAWELTESEHTDGHTRFVMLRGGAYLPPGESEWLVARGARPSDSHAKYVLLADGLDRSESVSFRTVADVAP